MARSEDGMQADSNSGSETVYPLSAEEVVDAAYVHPGARKLFDRSPIFRRIPVFGEAVKGFGPRCVISLGLIQFLCKGVANYLIAYSILPMFTRRYGLTGMEYQRMVGVTKLGTSVKPLVAVLSDMFALFSYTKRWYCAASCVLGAGMAVGYGLLPAAPASAATAAAFVFLTGFSKSNVDILIEGHYSRLMHHRPESGPALVSWVWWFIMIGAIVASFLQGPLSDAHLEHIGIFVSAALQLLTSVFFVFNWIEEKPNREERMEDQRMARAAMLNEVQETKLGDGDPTVAEGNVVQDGGDLVDLSAYEPFDELDDSDEPLPIRELCCGAVEFNTEVLSRNRLVLIYSALMAVGVVSMAIVTILGTKQDLLIASVTVSVFLGAFAFYALPKMVAKVSLYIFAHMAFYLQFPGALDTFYTAGPDCLPDGPQFNLFFYYTIGSVIGNVGGIVGVTLFSYVFSKRSYRLSFIITMMVQILGSVFDIIIVKRWNIRVGINDHIMYVMGDQIVYQVCYMLSWMPCVLLISRVCPKGAESMVYSVLAGFANLGLAMSNNFGSILMEHAFPVVTKPPCDFHNVPMLLLIGHFLLPLISIALVFVLIPNARVCDDIDLDGNVKLKKGDEEGNAIGTSQE
ncbi:putative folate/pteridine transporter [Trypanosoma grayi]|uniref:putative folate/pteridine transporter n=1 Tax=Trypanosoma grayi TaxID=71804 RepID=UPI0004F423FE|nr:putative folate/pteridine transporter [Trypanosoma grayi]KEG10138.1 putative folate/pteridine transporter [Trypanosoma grayi]